MPELRNPQQDVIETLDCPIIVQAGAGSGKTHTLTERIVAALTPDAHGHKAARSIENIVAITFTRKAAEELKNRLRTRLEQVGLHDQSLIVDNANITTIHGFASRILKENALSFGIDANFQIISEAEDEQIFNNSLETAMMTMYSGADIFEDFLMNAANQAEEFFEQIKNEEEFNFEDKQRDEYKPLNVDIISDEEKFDFAEEIRDQIESLISDFIAQQSGDSFGNFIANELWSNGTVSTKAIYDSVRKLVYSFATQPLHDEPHVFVGTYMEISDILQKIVDLLKNSTSTIKFDLKKDKEVTYANGIDESIKKIDSFLQDSQVEVPSSSLSSHILEILDDIPKLTPKFHSNSDDYAHVLAYRQTLAKLCLESLISLNRDAMMIYYRLATLTFEEMNNRKNNFKFSNNDLLRVCYQKLHSTPKVAKCYQDMFDLIMVDEFQDTDALQLELIKLVSKENFDNVCVVGDVQQSIYRFRGADVNVFKNYKDRMTSNNTKLRVIELPNNYRSHSDILSLTDKIFVNSNMFGEDFLHLFPKGKVNNEHDTIFDDIPRVQMQIMNHQTSGKEKFLTHDATIREAKKAAEHLKALKDAGAHPGSMAILLSKLSSGAETSSPTEIAKIYQKELLKVGIESVISGGSTFTRSDEARIVLNLLAIARNALDSDALVNLLRSEMFNISDDIMITLATGFSDDGTFNHKQDISYGFLSMDVSQLSTLCDKDIEAFMFAQNQIISFMQNIASIGIIPSIREFLSECGIFDKLEEMGSVGLVRAGNFEKALAVIKEIQFKTTEITEVHNQFADFLENAKEAPGILSNVNSDYVEIMTVHASKGLQFDHVVISELKNGISKRQSSIVSTTPLDSIGQYTYYSAVKNVDRKNLKSFTFDKDLLFANDVMSDKKMSAGQLYVKLAKKEQEEELGEAKRLLYVALTRAVKSVLLQVRIDAKPKDDYNQAGIWSCLYDAFKWDYNCAKSTQFFDLMNGSKGKLDFEFLPQALDFDKNDLIEDPTDIKTEKTTFSVRKPIKTPHVKYGLEQNSEFLSYSTLEKNVARTTLDAKLDASLHVDLDKASNFGSQVHSYLEKAIILSKLQIDNLESGRLKSAIKCIIENQAFKNTLKYEILTPEMEFCVPIEVAGSIKFLRGQMDLVGIEAKKACVIDYKTGTKPIDHALQAKVYAYALIKSGLRNVRLHFIHAEIPSSDQSFEFFENEAEALRLSIEQEVIKL